MCLVYLRVKKFHLPEFIIPNQDTNLRSGIRDNLRRGTVYEFLEQEIKNGSVLSIVSAYFTINAFEALQKPLNEIENLRFLFGDPAFIKSLDPTNTEQKAFRLTDTGLELHKQLQQKLIAKACGEWIKEKVEIRSTRASNLLHGKRQAEKEFKKWEEDKGEKGQRDKTKLLEALGAEFFQLGRIDRIGSRNATIKMINYWPTEDMEVYLRLQSRVASRMALADTAASGDDDPLNEFTYQQAQMELNFRDEQLMQLREDVLDLDDLSDGVVMSDFTLDYFFIQLLKYLERNRAELEATPKDAYAVTDNRDRPAETGVIFFLQQLNPTTDTEKKTPSPIYPYYMVYICKNGDIRYGCANTKQILDLFEATILIFYVGHGIIFQTLI